MSEQTGRPVTREDVEVSLAVARDLGPGSEPAVVGEFLDRVGPAIDARVDARVATGPAGGGKRAGTGQPALAFASIGVGIPITAIVLGSTDGGLDGVLALVVAWLGLVGVNAAASLRRPD